MISGVIALQYNVSNKILVERNGDSDSVFALDTHEAQLLRFGAGDEIITEAAQIASAAGGGLRRLGRLALDSYSALSMALTSALRT